MEPTTTLSGLIQKRAEISGELDKYQNIIRTLTLNLDSIDAAILVFDPDTKLEGIKPKACPRHKAYKGQITRAILGTLMNARKPMTSVELAHHVMIDRGLDTHNKKLVKLMAERTAACLRNHRKRKIVKSSQGIGAMLAWEIVR